jgi:hypothetical protein
MFQNLMLLSWLPPTAEFVDKCPCIVYDKMCVFIVRFFFVMQFSFDAKHYNESSPKLITRFYSICIWYQYYHNHLKFPTGWILWQSVWACISSHRHASSLSKWCIQKIVQICSDLKQLVLGLVHFSKKLRGPLFECMHSI